MIRVLIFLLLLSFQSCAAMAQEVVAKLDDAGKIVINEELRKSRISIRNVNAAIAAILPVDLADTDEITGILAVANGGTGVSVAPDLTHSRLYTVTSDFTVPTDVTQVFVSCVGGGGGGGAAHDGTNECGSGGSKGAISQTFAIPVTATSVHTVTIGAAGVGSTTSAAGTTGGASWFSTTNFTAAGGAGGASWGTGGGCSGNNGFVGQDSFYGTGGTRGLSGGSSGGNASGYSAGGGGGGVANGNGGNGTKGFCSVIW